ncbi:caprin-2-like [Ruditapes philippinarum]|uniref:caprin-2-like n=1 Tax=Ruditapes philippinarum TaxID=129788 RepID=UPI00295A860E|nr:caprin-2-like [Ruditapes philippinarum]
MFNKIVILFLVLGANKVNSLLLDEQPDSSVLQLLVKLEADVNNNKAQLKELQEACTCSGSNKDHSTAFMASLGHRITGCLSEHPVIFDQVKLNQGSGYDNRHGTFRAPVNGTYQISATLSSTPNNVGFHVAFVKNLASNSVGYLYADANQPHWQEKSTSLVLHLNAGDDVWISCLSDSTIHGDQTGTSAFHSHFSGFLISKD